MRHHRTDGIQRVQQVFKLRPRQFILGGHDPIEPGYRFTVTQKRWQERMRQKLHRAGIGFPSTLTAQPDHVWCLGYMGLKDVVAGRLIAD